MCPDLCFASRPSSSPFNWTSIIARLGLEPLDFHHPLKAEPEARRWGQQYPAGSDFRRARTESFPTGPQIRAHLSHTVSSLMTLPPLLIGYSSSIALRILFVIFVNCIRGSASSSGGETRYLYDLGQHAHICPCTSPPPNPSSAVGTGEPPLTDVLHGSRGGGTYTGGGVASLHLM